MKIDFELRKRIIEEIPEILKCYQCGTCVAACPAQKYGNGYSPRRKILAASYGNKELFNDELWKCTTCNSCNERCPQGVNPYEVLVKLKNFAVKNKLSGEKFGSSSDQVEETGYSLAITERVNKKRETLGLKPLKPNKELKKLFE